MHELGRLQDLPDEYRDALTAHNLVPLWPSLRTVLPPHLPTRRTQATCWHYADLLPLLLRAGELTPMEKAERRVLVLANPGHGLEKMQASAAMYLGMQLLLPGEWAPSHRHTPNAVRMVVQGRGAWTTVDGERCEMERGDLILTPTGLWHEHGHDGDEPVVWLDVLDLPLIYYTETSYAIEGQRQRTVGPSGERAYRRGGLVPTPIFTRSDRPYPMLRYRWADTRAALNEWARHSSADEPVQVTYVNPETGGDAQNILGFYALMLRPGERLNLPARSPAVVYHVIEGAAQVLVNPSTDAEQRFDLQGADTCCVPGYTAVSLVNASPDAPAYLFLADEAPLHRKLGVYEVR